MIKQKSPSLLRMQNILLEFISPITTCVSLNCVTICWAVTCSLFGSMLLSNPIMIFHQAVLGTDFHEKILKLTNLH